MSGFRLSGNPEMDAQRYAQQYNVTLSEAKETLRAKFGDPPPPQNFMQEGFANMYNTGAKNFMPSPFGIPQSDFMQKMFMDQNPEYIQPFPRVEQDLMGSMGTPIGDIPPSKAKELVEKYGIPPEVVAQGDDAIRKYAQENNIDLPPKQ